MTKVVVDDAKFVAVLDKIEGRSEICDATGRVLGIYVPRGAGPVVYKGAKSPFSKEELDRRFREEAKDARSLSQFWEDMRKKHPEQFP